MDTIIELISLVTLVIVSAALVAAVLTVLLCALLYPVLHAFFSIFKTKDKTIKLEDKRDNP